MRFCLVWFCKSYMCSFKLAFIKIFSVVSWFPGNAYNQEERVVCAGYDNGDIKLFDLRNMSLRWETNIKNGVMYIWVLSMFLFTSELLQIESAFNNSSQYSSSASSFLTFLGCGTLNLMKIMDPFLRKWTHTQMW